MHHHVTHNALTTRAQRRVKVSNEASKSTWVKRDTKPESDHRRQPEAARARTEREATISGRGDPGRATLRRPLTTTSRAGFPSARSHLNECPWGTR